MKIEETYPFLGGGAGRDGGGAGLVDRDVFPRVLDAFDVDFPPPPRFDMFIL